MTALLSQLFKDYGFLAAMVRNLDAARELWSQLSVAPDIGMNQYNFEESFVDGYRLGESRLKDRTPAFLYGMCLVQAYGLLEHYLNGLVHDIVRSNPRVLLSNQRREDRKVEYRLVIDNLDSPEKLLDELVNRELMKLAYGSLENFIAALRERFGLSALPCDFDDRIGQLALIRNCIVHNRGTADNKLSEASRSFYAHGRYIHVDRNMVSRSITTFCQFASLVDQTAINSHFKKPRLG